MQSEILGVCAVKSGSERKLREDIERAGFGTRLLSFRVTTGDRCTERSLIPGLVFTYLKPGYGVLDEIDGVRVLRTGGLPIRIFGRDEERLDTLELGCLMGEFNRVKARNAAGRFTSSPVAMSRAKQKKRRRRSLTARAERRRKRRAKMRGLRNHPQATNQAAA